MYFPFPTSGKIFLYTILNVQYILIHATNKMPCSGSLLKYQHLQSDACNSDGYFMCKYCSNCVLFFVPARLLWRLSCWCSVWWCQKTFCHVPPLARLWYMIDKQLRQDELCLFFVDHNQTTLGLIGNSLWEVLWNQVQYCDEAVYWYIAVICHLFRPIFTRQAVIH